MKVLVLKYRGGNLGDDLYLGKKIKIKNGSFYVN